MYPPSHVALRPVHSLDIKVSWFGIPHVTGMVGLVLSLLHIIRSATDASDMDLEISKPVFRLALISLIRSAGPRGGASHGPTVGVPEMRKPPAQRARPRIDGRDGEVFEAVACGTSAHRQRACTKQHGGRAFDPTGRQVGRQHHSWCPDSPWGRGDAGDSRIGGAQKDAATQRNIGSAAVQCRAQP